MTQEQARELGEFIRSLRVRQGIGLRELAGRSGISPANLSKIEAGSILQPAAQSLQRIAKELSCDYEDLAMLAGYSLPEGLPTLPVYLRTKYDELSADEIRQVEGYVRFLRQQHDEGDIGESGRGQRRGNDGKPAE